MQKRVLILKRIVQCLRSDKAEADYISATIFMFVGVIFVTFALNVFSIISAKLQLDQAADQLTKQIQLAGGINGETDALYAYIANDIQGVRNIQYTIDADYLQPTPSGMRQGIQLGTPFYVQLTADATLGGFGDILPVQFGISSRSAGVSERYWKP